MPDINAAAPNSDRHTSPLISPGIELNSRIPAGTIALPDQIATLPPRARKSGGRHHKPTWQFDFNKSFEAPEASLLTFGAQSIQPRQMVTFNRKKMTFSFLSNKTLTTQSGESPWELLLAKYLETSPHVVDYQFHNAKLTWSNSDVIRKTYGPDATYVEAAGPVTCVEVKASDEYFSDPETRSICDAAAIGLQSVGMGFVEITGDQLQADRRRAFNVSLAFIDRLTAFSPRQVDDVRTRLARGPCSVREVKETIRIPSSAGMQILNAMMVKRHLAYDMSAAVTDDLMVEAPPPVSEPPRSIRTINV